MQYRYVKTGPFTLEKIDNSDPFELRLKFSDVDKDTGVKNIRCLKKGGRWPKEFAERLLEKATRLVGKSVYVVTSQTTKMWPTTEWLCDIEPIIETATKASFAKKVTAADGTSDLVHFLAYSGKNLIDYSLAQQKLTKESEFEDFWKNLQSNFEQSWRSPKTARKITDDIRRIRIKGAGSLSKRNGYRVTVWQATQDHGIQFFIVLDVDEKLEAPEFPSNQEIRKIRQLADSLRGSYDPAYIKKALDAAFDAGEKATPVAPPASTHPVTSRVYLRCPFEEKDECKALGGRWDPEQKKWFVPEDTDPLPFAKWRQ